MGFFKNKISKEYQACAKTELFARCPSPDDVTVKFITYEYFTADGTLLRSETVTDRELTREEIWKTLQLIGASRVRWICECGIVPTVLRDLGDMS